MSPFILDENTFEAVPDTSLSKLYFFAWRQAASGRLHYKFVNDPLHDTIDLEDPIFFDRKKKTTKYALAVEQFNLFFETILTP